MVCREAANSIESGGARQEIQGTRQRSVEGGLFATRLADRGASRAPAGQSVMVAARFRAIVFVDDVDDAHDRPNGESQDDDDGERDDAGHVDSS